MGSIKASVCEIETFVVRTFTISYDTMVVGRASAAVPRRDYFPSC